MLTGAGENQRVRRPALPEGWKVVRLADDHVARVRGGRKNHGVREIAVIPMELVPDSAVFTGYIVQPVAKARPSTYCEAGDLLLAKITPSLENGKQGIVPRDVPNGFAFATSEVYPIECGGINNFFLFYVLKHPRYRQTLIASMTGTTGRQRVSRRSVERLQIPLPPLPEQERIAEILSTVDRGIEKADDAIERTRRLKRGMMSKLLMRGISHQEFKDTEIGRIPTEWHHVKLGDPSIAELRGSRRIRTHAKVAVVPMGRVPDSSIFVEFDVRPLEEVKSYTYCESDDVLLAKITPSLENGKQGIVPSNIPNGFALATTEVYPIVCKGIHNLFLFYVLKFSKYRNRIIASMTGTTGRQRASKLSVENLAIPLPPLPEQRRIASILSTVDARLDLLRRRKERLRRIKQGLMNDLLTGRRRVRVGA